MTGMNSWGESLSDLLSTQNLTTLLATGIAAGVGTWGGAVVTLRKQSKIAKDDRDAQAEFAAQQRVLDQDEQRAVAARNAAADLLEPVAALRKVVPYLPALGDRGSMAEQQVTPMGARRAAAREALDLHKHGMWTALLRVDDEELARRYRALGTVVSDLAYGDIEPDSPMMNRAQLDVENYIKYVLISLKRFMDGEPLPERTTAPYLKRADGAAWHPEGLLPDEWEQI
jgi:hypothetical protein